MATKVIITEQYLRDIADAIREKANTHLPLKPPEMAPAIKQIPQGITPEGTLEITENGQYDVADKESVDVDVPNPSSGALDIDENGNYDVRDKAFARVNVPLDPLVAQMNGIYERTKGGYDRVTVSVPPYSRRNKTLAITENGTYNFKDDPSASGDEPPATLTVNVDSHDEPTGTKNITQNGTYDVSDYATAEVDVPNPATGTKNITENGTHNIKDYEYAAVDVPPYGEGTTSIVTSDSQGTYNVDGYKYAEVSVSMDELEVTQNGTYQPRYDQMIAGYNKVKVNVPNTLTPEDEGKVVENGTLVSQSTKQITQNGTYDTTKNNSVVVVVPTSVAKRITLQDVMIYQGASPVVGTPLTIVSMDHPDVDDYAIVLGIRVYTYQGSAHRAFYLIEGVVTSLDATNNRFTMLPDTVIEDVVKVSGGYVIDRAGTYTRDVTDKKSVSVNIEEGYKSSDVKMIPSRYISSSTGDPTTDTYIYVTLTENDMYDLDVSHTGTLVCTEFGTYMVTGIIQNKEYNDQDKIYTLEIEVVNQIS